MIPTHETLVLVAKTFGLFWMMGFFVIVVVLAYRPSRKAAHDRAARSILIGTDQPGSQPGNRAGDRG